MLLRGAEPFSDPGMIGAVVNGVEQHGFPAMRSRRIDDLWRAVEKQRRFRLGTNGSVDMFEIPVFRFPHAEAG